MAQRFVTKQLPAQSIDRKLRELLEAQHVDGNARPNDSTSAGIFDQFLTKGEARRVYDEAVDYLRSHESLKNFEDSFLGRIFEDLAFMYLFSRDFGPTLSPQKTFEFFRWLYPHDGIKSHPMGFDSLEGIYVPDGLVLEEQNGLYNIILVCEYTSRDNPDTLRKKINGFRRRLKEYPTIFHDSQLLFIVPEGGYSLGSLGEDVAVERMPFRRTELRRFNDGILGMSIDGKPSIKELIEEAANPAGHVLGTYGRHEALRTPLSEALSRGNARR